MDASNISNATVQPQTCTIVIDSSISFMISEIVGVLGIISNLAFLFVTARVKSLHSATNYLLVSLCLSDVLYLTIHVTLQTHFLPQTALWKNILCYKGTITTGLYVTSILTVLSICVERYLGICHPIMYKARELGRPKKIVPMIIGLWLFGLVYAFIYTLHCYVEPEKYNVRAPYWFGAVTMTLMYFITLIVIIVLYTFIVRLLHASTSRIENSKKVLRDRIQVVRLCIVTAVVFFICLFPRSVFFVGYFHYLVTNDDRFAMNLWCWNPLFIIILMVNSGVNPMIYILTCSRYRRAFGQAFGCLPPERERRRGTSFTSTYNRKFSDMSGTCMSSASTRSTNYIPYNGDKVKLHPSNENTNLATFDANDNSEQFV